MKKRVEQKQEITQEQKDKVDKWWKENNFGDLHEVLCALVGLDMPKLIERVEKARRSELWQKYV